MLKFKYSTITIPVTGRPVTGSETCKKANIYNYELD